MTTKTRSISAWTAAILCLGSTAHTQDAAADLEFARLHAQDDAPTALLRLERALASGSDSVEAHLLHARLLLASGRHDEARCAAKVALDRLVADRRAVESLLEAIDSAAVAKGGATSPPAAAPAPAVPEPAPTVVDDSAAAAERRAEGDRLLASGAAEQALPIFTTLSRSAVPQVADPAKDRLVDVVRQLAASADALRLTDPPRSHEQYELALQQCVALRDGELRAGPAGSPDRSFAAAGALVRTGDGDVAHRAALMVLDWLHDCVARGNAALAASDKRTAFQSQVAATKAYEVLRGASDDALFDAHVALCGSKDPTMRRRALQQFVAWGKQLVAEAEALLAADAAAAAAKLASADKAQAWLRGAGDLEGAAAIDQRLAESSEERFSGDARQRLGKLVLDMIDSARAALRDGQPVAAAVALATAFHGDSSRRADGAKAAELYEAADRRQEAAELYRTLAEGSDEVAAKARIRAVALERWARAAFAGVEQSFKEALARHKAIEALAIVREPLSILDRSAVASIEMVLASGALEDEAAKSLGVLAAQLRAPEVGVPTTGPRAGLLTRPPKVGEQFEVACGSTMRPVLPGRFESRSEGATADAAHGVTISQPFWVTTTQVTAEQWRAAWPAWPVFVAGSEMDVTWNSAIMFCLRLTQQESDAGRLPAGYSYTLPTEAEWEYLTRDAATSDAGDPNVYEWCLDASDGRPPATHGEQVDPLQRRGEMRVLRRRGSAQRLTYLPYHLTDGRSSFRVVLAPRPPLDPPYKQ